MEILLNKNKNLEETNAEFYLNIVHLKDIVNEQNPYLDLSRYTIEE